MQKIEDITLENDLNNGEIYCVKNNINGKYYIGQALCFTGSNNNKWGTNGRWKSHLREALNSNNQDHCILLNNAIRKYGKSNFEVSTLKKCHRDELDENEIHYIEQFNSIKPFGYNIKAGGYKSKLSEDTILKMKEAHMGHEHSEDTKGKIGKSQIGNRRNTMKRRNPEDDDLPKYIICSRDNNIIKRYIICGFPIGIDQAEYLPSVSFTISKYGSKEIALQNAIEHLNQLKKQYEHIYLDIKENKDTSEILSITQKKENIFKDKLPEYIYPIIEENKIKGYYVDNIMNNKNKKYSKREFIDKTNRWNLDQAKKFVDILNYINEHNVDLKFLDSNDLDINDVNKSFYEKYYLPKYFNVLRKKSNIEGFVINGYPDDKYKDGKFKREFQLKGRTMNEAYEEGIDYLENLKLGIKM